ncbi:Follistatin- protein 5 [Branchiostoma belcheri]|nr:Follistatin- protein 5 [Branchiostoma belcheri]
MRQKQLQADDVNLHGYVHIPATKDPVRIPEAREFESWLLPCNHFDKEYEINACSETFCGPGRHCRVSPNSGNELDKEYEINACSETFCGPGRHCRVNPESGDAECVCLDACRPHKKPVCGNDGKLYPNHCELHRMACVLKKRIAIAHNKDCFYQDSVKKQNSSQKL